MVYDVNQATNISTVQAKGLNDTRNLLEREEEHEDMHKCATSATPVRGRGRQRRLQV